MSIFSFFYFYICCGFILAGSKHETRIGVVAGSRVNRADQTDRSGQNIGLYSSSLTNRPFRFLEITRLRNQMDKLSNAFSLLAFADEDSPMASSSSRGTLRLPLPPLTISRIVFDFRISSNSQTINV